jgi:hypothetical protein
MPTSCTWDDDAKSIIYVAYEGDWTWEEYFEASDTSREMAQSVTHRVDVICDFKRGRSPRTGSQMANGQRAMRNLAPNTGIVVTVDNLFTKTLLGIFKAIDRRLGAIIFGSASVEEARAIIAKHRATQAPKV